MLLALKMEDVLRAKEFSWSVVAGKDKGIDSPREPLEGCRSANTWILAP